MDERVLNLLQWHEERLEELLALIEHLHHTDQLRYFDNRDFRALEVAHDALGVEIRQHKEGA